MLRIFLIAVLLAAPAAPALPDELDQVPIDEIRQWPGYKTIPAVDPYRDEPRLTENARGDIEARLRKGLVPDVGAIQQVTVDDSLPQRREHAFRDRRRPLPHWRVEGKRGVADVWTDASGVMQVEVENNEGFPSHPSSVAIARALLRDVWGGEPGEEPHALRIERERVYIDWYGPDGKTAEPQTTIHVEMRRQQLHPDGKEERFKSRFIVECGTSADNWKKLDAEGYRKLHGGPGARQAIARAVFEIDAIVADAQRGPRGSFPAKLDELKVRRALRSGGWQIQLVSDAEMAHPTGRTLVVLNVTPELRINGIGTGPVDPDDTATMPLAHDLPAVRQWPEYREIADQQGKTDAILDAAWAQVKPRLGEVLKAVRGEAGDWPDQIRLAREWSSATSLCARKDSTEASPGLIDMKFDLTGKSPRLVWLDMRLPPTGKEPPYADLKAWDAGVTAVIEKLFGQRPAGLMRRAPVTLYAAERRKLRAGTPEYWQHIVSWSPGWKGKPLPESHAISCQAHEPNMLMFHLAMLPDAAAEAVRKINDVPLRFDARHAAQLVVKTAPFIVPDVDLTGGKLSAVLDPVNAAGVEFTIPFAVYVDRPAIVALAARSSLAPMWNVEIELPKLGAIHAMVDPEKGTVVQLAHHHAVSAE